MHIFKRKRKIYFYPYIPHIQLHICVGNFSKTVSNNHLKYNAEMATLQINMK